jgi:hypothetical protein
VAVFLLLALAAVAGAIGIGGIWANQQLLDTGAWVSSTDRMLRSPEIRHRVSTFLTEELTAQAREEIGGTGFELSGAEEARLREGVTATTERALSTPRVRKIWHRANREAHRSLLRILDGGASSDSGDAVVLDLNPAVRVIAAEISYGGLRLGTPPASFGRIDVFEESELRTAQDVVGTIRHLPLIAGVVVALLFGLALAGAGSARRGFAAIGLSLVTMGALALIARVIAGHRIVDALVGGGRLRAVGFDAWEIATSTVVTLSTAAIALGALIALAAVLLGDSAPALALRRGLGTVLESPAGRLGGALAVALVFVVLVVWTPIAAFGQPLGVLLFALVIGTGTVLLGRLTLAERTFMPLP